MLYYVAIALVFVKKHNSKFETEIDYDDDLPISIIKELKK
tara:strand:+ start:577 stop:696 length:120 start_codon:yes stop_codon:yes gene_type:complete